MKFLLMVTILSLSSHAYGYNSNCDNKHVASEFDKTSIQLKHPLRVKKVTDSIVENGRRFFTAYDTQTNEEFLVIVRINESNCQVYTTIFSKLN